MLHRLVHAAIALFWIATMTAVAVHERRGHGAAGGAGSSFVRFAPPRVEPRPMEQFRILFGGRAIGTITNEILPADGGGVRVTSRTEGEVPLLGIATRIDLRVSALLDRASRLESLVVELESPGASFSARGEVRDGFLELRSEGGPAPGSARIRVPDGVWIAPGAGVLLNVPPDARVGDRWSFPILNPLTLAIDEGFAVVVAERDAEGGAAARREREVEITVGSLTSRATIDASGSLLREVTPLGLSLERIAAPGEGAGETPR